MAGLLNQSMQNKPMQNQPMQGGAPAMQGAPPDSQDTGSATPEEQEQYDRFVMAATKIIYDDETNKAIIQGLQSGKDDPAGALVKVANFVIQYLNKQSNQPTSVEIQTAASEEILSELATIADKNGIFKIDNQVIEDASMMMAQMLVGGENGQPT